MNQQERQERNDRRLSHAYDQAGAAGFVHPADAIEPPEERELIAQFADALSPVFAFIAKGRLSGTMDVRSWAVLYCLGRVGGETIQQGAARFGLSHNRVHLLVKEFRACVPGMTTPFEKSAATRARMSAAHRRPTPSGVRNLFPAARDTGSA